MQVFKWGNNLAIRLPGSVVRALELKEGDDINIEIAENRQFRISKKPTVSGNLKRLRKFRGQLPADFIWNREKANTRSESCRCRKSFSAMQQ